MKTPKPSLVLAFILVSVLGYVLIFGFDPAEPEIEIWVSEVEVEPEVVMKDLIDVQSLKWVLEEGNFNKNSDGYYVELIISVKNTNSIPIDFANGNIDLFLGNGVEYKHVAELVIADDSIEADGSKTFKSSTNVDLSEGQFLESRNWWLVEGTIDLISGETTKEQNLRLMYIRE